MCGLCEGFLTQVTSETSIKLCVIVLEIIEKIVGKRPGVANFYLVKKAVQ